MTSHQVAIIQHEAISRLGITPGQCVDWVRESFMAKPEAQLPPKISLHPQGDDFFNTMPTLLPSAYGRFSVKVVHRIAGQVPSLGADILLYDSATGHLLALLDGDWITTMRTGAVAALTISLLAKRGATTFSLMGLGNTARATALCLMDMYSGKSLTFRLLKYKNQAESFIERFSGCSQARFEVVDDVNEFVRGAEVLVSCITSAQGLICSDDSLYMPGMLLIPVHTRGFQNCDLFFDKIYGDDRGHIQGFKYFEKFRQFDELGNVLMGLSPGRESDEERILCYNIGLGLHDAVFASHIYDLMCRDAKSEQFIQHKETEKFWI